MLIDHLWTLMELQRKVFCQDNLTQTVYQSSCLSEPCESLCYYALNVHKLTICAILLRSRDEYSILS
jgi:hypothetical protein